MDSDPTMSNIEKKPEAVEDSASSESNTDQPQKLSSRGIVLVPQPSDDPADPLNWPMWRKVSVLAIVSLAAFIGIAQALANQSGFFVQGAVYKKTAVEMSYSISAAIAGLATGPLVWAPLSERIGRSSCIFWGMIGTFACGIWSAEMKGANQYIPFVISRWLGGTFGSAASTIGAGTMLDIFFLHQRGKAFVGYTLCTLFGTQVGPTVGGFILQHQDWPVQFWWTVAVEGLVIVLVFLFLEETRFDHQDPSNSRRESRSWIGNRAATFFPGTKVAPQDGSKRNSPFSMFLIAICPVTLLAGGFLMISFGWAVAVTTLLSVFLQTPEEIGGYGFTPLRNAEFSFAQWVGVGAAYIYGGFANDRVPLWMCRRNGGIWRPEFRLYPLLVPPFIILPIGLGIFGAALQYHLHYMVLALAVFLINFCEIALVPVVINYVVESFTHHPAEVTTILNFYRLILGLAVPFFIDGWEAAVKPGWVFGMMAFFTIFAFSATVLLAIKGPKIRKLSFAQVSTSEEGVDLKLASQHSSDDGTSKAEEGDSSA